MYCIREDYVARTVGDYDFEIGITDDWQAQVYSTAWHLQQAYHYGSVLDVGCGRGFKLLQHFGDIKFCGLDMPPTVAWLQENYSGRDWQVIDYQNPPQGYELLICADVIEHVEDPDALLSFIKRCEPKHIVISTPDRDLLAELFYQHYLNRDPNWKGQNGPPFNKCHLREWNFSEFEQYIGTHLKIEAHFHAPRQQACQCVIARR